MAVLPARRRNRARVIEKAAPRADEGLRIRRRRRVPAQSHRYRVSFYFKRGWHSKSLTAGFLSLRLHPRRLSELREKLFILWGDLEEKKRNAFLANNEAWTPIQHSSLPFQCCVREYGVRCAHPEDPDAMVLDGYHGEPCSQPDCFGWERRFAMFGTTIHDPQ